LISEFYGMDSTRIPTDLLDRRLLGTGLGNVLRLFFFQRTHLLADRLLCGVNCLRARLVACGGGCGV
jgi:hypothetical protein